MKYKLLTSAFLLINIILSAQPDLQFVRYTTLDGLINNDVLTISQDSLGFMWFGTGEGCSRFDGIDFKNYHYQKKSPDGIGGAFVSKIVHDTNYNLWCAFVGGDKSFMKYDHLNDKFFAIPTWSLVSGNNLWNIYADRENNIWFSNGVSYYNPSEDSIHILKKGTAISDFCEDDSDNLWMATNSKGVLVYNKANQSFSHFTNSSNNPQSISSDKCRCIYRDSDNQIWVGTYDGLNRFVEGPMIDGKITGNFERFAHKPGDPLSLSNNTILDIMEYDKENLIVATINGLGILHKKSKTFHTYYTDETNRKSVNSNIVRQIFRDRDNSLWLATNQGVGKVQSNTFKTYQHSAFKSSISHNKIEFICEVDDGNVWIATPLGIDVFDPVNKNFQFLKGVLNTKNDFGASPVMICPDRQNGFWVGTWGAGMSLFDGTGKRIYNDMSRKIEKLFNYVFQIYIDKKNRIWFSGEGLYMYDAKTGGHKHYLPVKNDTTSISTTKAAVMIEDSDSTIWVGTNISLDKLIDIETGKFTHYLQGMQINCIIENSDKDLLIGTQFGLYKHKRETGEFIHYGSTSDIYTSVYGILEEDKNTVWISLQNQLSKLVFIDDSLISRNNFFEENGFEIDNSLKRSCAKLSDGTMLFGGIKGFCMFHPSKILTDTIVPTVKLTQLIVNGSIVTPKIKLNNQVVLNKTISLAKEIILNHKNNNFTIEFAGLHYNHPKQFKYAYSLTRKNASIINWTYADAKHRQATYMNLPAGEYSFKVKAANSFGVRGSEYTQLSIKILPPWWRTDWFLSLVFIILIGIIYSIIRIRTYKLQKQKETLEALVGERTKQLKEANLMLEEGKEELEQQARQLSQMNAELLATNNDLEQKTVELKDMAKQLHEADQQKLRFFANISHEFRTPLTLIISPVEQWLKNHNPKDVLKIKAKSLSLVFRNAQRLLRLVNEIIDFRKIDQGQKKLHVTRANIKLFIENIIEAFSPLAETKNIQLLVKNEEIRVKSEEQLTQNTKFFIHHSSLITQFWFDSDIMEKILFNLISNAIKYTPEGGEILIEIGVVETQCIASLQNQLAIKITDTGIGIKPENLDKIFDRFYRVKTRLIASQPEGTGIGLSYTKQLVELHGGEISVESTPGEGTTFTIMFPFLGKQAELELNKMNDKKPKLEYIHTMLGLNQQGQNEEISNEEIKATIIAEKSTKKTKKETIIIVEDNADLRKFIKKELKSDYIILEASNGMQGWESIVENAPDLVVSDVMMPEMDGVELCTRIKTDEMLSHTPVILLTALNNEENMVKGLSTGADDYITKPFHMSVLKLKIKNLFEFRRKIKEKFYHSIDISPSEVTNTSIDEMFLQKAISIVNENMNDFDFTNDKFVDLMNQSRSVVYSKIKKVTGLPLSEFVKSMRLKAAAKLFLEGNDNISEVAFLVGYKHLSTMSRQFNKMFGKTPSQFVKEKQKRIGK